MRKDRWECNVGEGAYAGSCTKSGETCVLCIHAKVEVVQCMCVCVCVCVSSCRFCFWGRRCGNAVEGGVRYIAL
jgi:hypothetical protein